MTPSIRKASPHHSRHSHWRARYGETRTAGSEGGHTEKVLKQQEPRLVAYPAQETGGRVQMPGTVRREALRDMAKAGLPEAQSPVDEKVRPPERHLKPVPACYAVYV
jgi:hypothetical protein